VKLADLHPRWFAEAGRHGQGLTFDCPCCVGKPNAARLACAVHPPLDGGAPISLLLGDSPLYWALWGPERGADIVPPGIHWQRTGETFETLTLMPSVDASRAGHWHGFITNGQVQ
jgi:hypothetical protein